MKTLPTVYIGTIVLLIAILAVGLVTSRIGGSAIRTAAVQDASLDLLVSSPLTRGVPVSVSWADEGVSTEDVDVFFRHDGGESLVTTQVHAAERSIRVELPCDGASTGILIVREKDSGKTLGSQAVSLLSPGRDCALGG